MGTFLRVKGIPHYMGTLFSAKGIPNTREKRVPLRGVSPYNSYFKLNSFANASKAGSEFSIVLRLMQ